VNEPAKIIGPQKGPQTVFLSSNADIAVYGGAAGGGKTFALLMQPLRHIKNPGFGAVIFRRTNPQIVAEGGMWDQSHQLYSYIKDAKPYYGQSRQWVFRSGAKITFAHMEHEKNKQDWDSSQIPLIEFDELTSFSESMFVYMLTRNRSTCGIKPYMRAACNPDAESWVAKWVEWWIDQDTGYPILERSGIIRWFVRDGDTMLWFADKAQAVHWLLANREFKGAKTPQEQAEAIPKSFTFVPANLDDNKILDTINPEYRANLLAMTQVERERLLKGNWKIRPSAGLKFPRDKWVTTIQGNPIIAVPPGLRFLRFWDKAYTEGGSGARTAGVLMGELSIHQARAQGLPQFWIVHGEAGRWGDAERESNMRMRADMDQKMYGNVIIGIEQEGGAGKQAARASVVNLAGHSVYSEHPTSKKHLRWTPLASQQQIGNVAIVTDGWDWAQFVRELDALAGDEDLDKNKLRDYADAAAGAFKGLTNTTGMVLGELMCSGDPEEEAESRRPFTPKEIEELPDDLRELIEETNAVVKERGEHRWNQDDW